MTKNKIRSILGLAFMSLLLTVFAPTGLLAQSKSKGQPSKVNNKATKKAKPQVVNRGRAATPVKHYSNQPRRGTHVAALPQKSVVVRHHNLDYHYRDGIFYRPLNGGYFIAAPPIGIHISILPPNPYQVILAGRPYYYYYGTYYSPLRNGGYEVVTPPVGAIVDALPEGYEVFELDEKVYYRLDETYYKAVLDSSGYVMYEVVRI